MRLPARFPALFATLAIGVAVLAACGVSNGGTGPGNGAGQATVTGPRSSAATAVPTATDQLPTPDVPETAELLGALTAVDPGLAVDDASAVQNAVALCGALRDGDDATTAVPDTFPDVDLSASQQQAVAAAVTSGFCPLDGTSSSASTSPSASASPSAS